LPDFWNYSQAAGFSPRTALTSRHQETMIHFPHNPLKRAATQALAPVRQTFVSDVIWNKPVFKAPALSNPPIEIEPLPFTAARVTKAAR
jgi:hypothetical protein